MQLLCPCQTSELQRLISLLDCPAAVAFLQQAAELIQATGFTATRRSGDRDQAPRFKLHAGARRCLVWGWLGFALLALAEIAPVEQVPGGSAQMFKLLSR